MIATKTVKSLLPAFAMLFALVGHAQAEMTATEHLTTSRADATAELSIEDCISRALATVADHFLQEAQQETYQGDEGERRVTRAPESFFQQANYGIDAADDSVAVKMSWSF